MSGLLPSEMEPDVSADDDGELRVLSLDDEDAQELIASLSSDTARSLYSALHDDPATASELSETVGTSLQNVRHHLSSLEAADLVEVAGTRYSCKGREMNVYAPTGDSLVVCVGSEDDRERLADSLGAVSGIVVALAAVAALVQRLFGAGAVDLGAPGTAPRVGDTVGSASGPILGILQPGVAVFLGGILVVASVVAWERWRVRS